MIRQSPRRSRYAPETVVVEGARSIVELSRDALVAAHPRLLGHDELVSREERLAHALVRAAERFARGATRYLDYVAAVAVAGDSDASVSTDPDPRQIEMF